MASGHQKAVRPLNQKAQAVMRGSVAAIGVAFAAVVLSARASALSGPMPGSKLQNLAPANVRWFALRVFVRVSGLVFAPAAL
jgi:hypothetical protein